MFGSLHISQNGWDMILPGETLATAKMRFRMAQAREVQRRESSKRNYYIISSECNESNHHACVCLCLKQDTSKTFFRMHDTYKRSDHCTLVQASSESTEHAVEVLREEPQHHDPLWRAWSPLAPNTSTTLQIPPAYVADTNPPTNNTCSR